MVLCSAEQVHFGTAAMLQADWPTLSLSSGGIFSISTFALSLLLVFRTNSSYEVTAGDMQFVWMCLG
jgi:predicted membrane chloride channel (bestrophin family)